MPRAGPDIAPAARDATFAPSRASLPRDDRLAGLLRAAVARRTLDQPACALPTAAIDGKVPQPMIQRTEQSAALLTELAIPQIRPGPAVAVQKALVDKLDVEHRDEFTGGILNLGGILIDEMPETDRELIDEAELLELPTGGGFISAGSPRGGKIKALGFDRMVVENTLQTMIDARQIAYLRLAGLPDAEWKILIELHYYRERDMTATGMHKDTLGETLFVNLNYHMDKQVIGPETVINPPTSPERIEGMTGRLPATFREDLAATRETLDDPTEFQAGLVDAYGYVAFVDEAVHHATPFYGHRYVTGDDLRHYLQAKYPAQFREASTAYQKYAKEWIPWTFSSYLNKRVIGPADAGKWLAWMKIVGDDSKRNLPFTRVDLSATMTSEQFDDVLRAVAAYGHSPRTGGALGGFLTASIPRSDPQPITRRGRPPLKRRLSNPDFRRTLPPAPEATEKRCFFRTWIRVVPAAKAENLHNRMREAREKATMK